MQTAEEKKELFALMDYLVKHNISHTDELSELSEGVPEGEAKSLITKAIEEYEIANATLKNALEKMK